MAVEPIYWDTDAFLGWLQNEPDKAKMCAGTLDRADKGEVVIFTSALTIAEVLWMRGGPRVSRDKEEIVRKFFRRSYMKIRNVTRVIAHDAQNLVWDHGIKPKDAIHVATALEAKVGILETFDKPLIDKSGVVGAPPLIIRKPMPPKQGGLFDGSPA